MGIPNVTGHDFGGPTNAPLLVVGPSLGTSAHTLWGSAADRLCERFRVVGWDLPGHGRSRRADQPFSIAELTAGVLALADETVPRSVFHYAGDSVGGCVGLQLLLDAPDRVASATLLCTGAKIGSAESWHERAATVRGNGTQSVIAGSAQRWFAAGFLDREPEIGSALLQALSETDPEGYAHVCEALADFDATARLADIVAPVLAVAGREDIATPPESLQHIASGVRSGRIVVLDDVAHLAPAEAPRLVADLILEHAGYDHNTKELQS